MEALRRIVWVAPMVVALIATETVTAGRPHDIRRTSIVTPPVDGHGPLPPANGASDNTAFSQDNRDVRLLAFDSAATNLTSGDRKSVV